MAHSVVLNWTASIDVPADSYNVYRGTAAGQESTTPLNSAPITGTSYTDTTVQAGTTYFYIAKSISASGALSVASNEISATVPLAPPTSLIVATVS